MNICVYILCIHICVYTYTHTHIYIYIYIYVSPRCIDIYIYSLTGGSVVKNLSANAGDTGNEGLILRSGRFPGGRKGNPLQRSCLKNPMDRGAWQATLHGVAKSQAQSNT